MKTLFSTTTLFIFFFLVLCPRISKVTAQNSTASAENPNGNNRELYAKFSPSMAVIIVILVSALFFMGFFSIYIRHCSGSGGAGGSIRRGISMRTRREAAARGLDASVIESFPTFTYAEVKDHKIGKGALECAVCLNEFEDEETLRLLPKCDHVFHPQCVDAWLASHVTCPVCRADLAAEDDGGTSAAAAEGEQEVVIQIDDGGVEERGAPPTPRAQRQEGSFEYQNRSVKRPNRLFSFSRFRSHSTGHDSVVQPGENLDRFTLRLPAEVRKEVITRASLNRTRSCAAAAAALPRVGSSRRGYRAARFDRAAKSDRWAFFTRAFSMKSPRGARENGAESSQAGGRTAAKLPSFKCLEPSVHNNGDEMKMPADESGRSNPV